MKKAHKLTKPILVQNPYSNVDVLYGPYSSMSEALSTILPDVRKQGLTFGIINSTTGKVEEYWWNANDTNEGIQPSDAVPVKKVAEDLYGPYNNLGEAKAATEGQRKEGTTVGIRVGNKIKEYQWMSDNMSADPVEKIESNDIEISIPAGANVVTENADGKTFSLTYILKGRSFLSKGYLYINGAVAAEFTPAISQTGITETFALPNQIGRYQCRISVTDLFGQRVTTDVYTLNYGTISAYFNTKAVEDVSPKSLMTLNGVLVQATVNTIDKALYSPEAIQLGDRVLYSFTNSDTYPKSIDMYLPGDLAVQSDAKFSLKYRAGGNVLYIYDAYTFNILGENEVSVISGGQFEGFENNKLTIPVIVESGNPTFMFNIELTIGSKTFTYTNAPGNQSVNFVISHLPDDLIESGKDLYTANVTLKAVSTANKDIKAEKNIQIIIKKIGSYEPYIKNSNCFVFNTMHKTLERKTFTSSITSSDSPIVYYQNDDTVDFGGDPGQIILDAYLNISKTGQEDPDTGLKVPVIQVYTGSGQPFVTITEEEVVVGSIQDNLSTKLFLDGEYKHIAVVYNKKEVSEITGEVVRYDAIYVNGALIANRPSKGSFTGRTIKINPQNKAVFDLASLHVYGYGVDETPESFGSDGKDIIYRNYVSNLESIPSDNSCAKLQIVNINNIFSASDLYKTYNKKLKKLVPIGDVSGGKVSGESVVDTLLRMNTASKSLKIDGQNQQKAIATFCYYQYTSADGSVIENGITEVHTQGTSTLDYPVPNFKFTFYSTSGTSKVSKTWVSDIPEKDLTAKADYMDSSHLNNTPTCMFYNSITGNASLMEQLIPETASVDSAQSYARSHQIIYDDNSYYYSDAIFGEPCIIEYTDNQPNISSIQDLAGLDMNNINFINLGSFMLNTDKSAKSLGLDIVDDSENSYLHENGIEACYSLEGKSNIDNATDEGTQDPNAALFIYAGEVINKIPDLNWNFSLDDWDGLSLSDLNKFKDFIFESGALEFRSEIDPDEWESIEDLRKFLYPIARMWYFVARSSDAEFKQNFDDYFNRNYAFLYYINLMCFAQVDNLGKNSMFDSWDGYHWFPRPYDLDSQAGFNNQGGDVIHTYEEILPTDTFRGGNHTTDLNTRDDDGNDTTEQTIAALDNKGFSSKSSNLWKKIWNNFSDDIINVYATLRENGYSAENIIANAKRVVIDKISPNQYNIDFRKKYLGTSDHQTKAFGNRWDKFRWWITKRFDFCDTYFNYSNTMNIASSSSSYKVHVDTPQYVYISDDYTSRGRQLMLSDVSVSSSRGVVEHVMMSTNTITEITGSQFFTTFNIDTVPALARLKLNNLLALNLNGNKSNINIDNLYTKFNVIRTIDISNSTVSISNLPETIQNFYADGVTFGESTNPFAQKVDGRWVSKIEDASKYRLTNLQLKGFSGALVLENLPLLETIDLTDANITYLKLENLPNLQTLNITGCSFSGDVNIVNIKKNSLDFSNCDFNHYALNFQGTESNVQTLILNGVKNLDSINLDALNIETLDCRNSQIKNIYISRDNNNLTTFYVSPAVERIGQEGSVQQYTADMSHFKALTAISFYRCASLQHIKNLTFNGPGYISRDFNNRSYGVGIFERCKELVDITNSTITSTVSCARMFAYCYKLNNIQTVTIGTGVTSAEAMFFYNFNLTLAKILLILHTTSNLTNLSGCCGYIGLVTEINLTLFFGDNNPTNVSYLFTRGYESAFSIAFEATSTYPAPPAATLITVTGKLPSNVINASMLFAVQSKLETIPADMFEDVTSMTSCSYAFYSTAITGEGFTEDFFGKGYNTLNTISSTFASCKNLVLNLLEVNIFKKYPRLTNIGAVFSGSENIIGDITGIFNTNPSINIFENAFNGTGVSLMGMLKTNGNFQTAAEIGGMFSYNKAVAIYNQNTGAIQSGGINAEVLNNFDNIYMESASVVYTAGGASYRREVYGVFEGCKNLYGSFDNIVAKMENKDCSRMFKDTNAAVLFDPEITTLTLPDCTSTLKLFMQCDFSSLRKLKIIAFGNTRDIKATFCKSIFSNQTEITSLQFNENNEELDYLFAASDISFDVSNLTLPANTISTRYMFSYHAPFKGNEFVTSTSRTGDQIDAMFDNGNLSNSVSGETDSYEYGSSTVYEIGYPSDIKGVLGASAFGSEEEPLTKLRYTAHMFDRCAIESVGAGLFGNCPNIIDCRFMFARCRKLKEIAGTVEGVKDIFTGDIYTSLRDVSGMFYNGALDNEVGISLVKARNLERADAMFGQIYPQGHNGITFTQDIFNTNNTALRSMSQFATNTRVLVWPNMSDIFGIVQFAKYSFARTGMTNAKANALFTENSRFSRLKNMMGLFACNGSSLTATNIDTIKFAATVIKTGNFYNTGVTGGSNVDLNQVSLSVSISNYPAQAY